VNFTSFANTQCIFDFGINSISGNFAASVNTSGIVSLNYQGSFFSWPTAMMPIGTWIHHAWILTGSQIYFLMIGPVNNLGFASNFNVASGALMTANVGQPANGTNPAFLGLSNFKVSTSAQYLASNANLSSYSPVFPLASDSSTTVLIQGSPRANAVNPTTITDFSAFSTALMPALGNNLPTSQPGALDLTNGWLSEPTVNIQFTNLTVKTWVYMTGTSGGDIPSLFETRPQNSPHGFACYVAADGHLGIWIASPVNAVVSLGGAMSMNAWNHVAWVLNSGQWSGYINGIKAGASFTNPMTWSNIACINLGVTSDQWSLTSYKFLGKIFQPMITASARYTDTFTPALDLSANAASSAFFVNVDTNGAVQDVISGNALTKYNTVTSTYKVLA